MANAITCSIDVVMYADGTSDTFSFDLLTDSYSVSNGGATGSDDARSVNWFSEDPKSSVPTGVQAVTTDLEATDLTYTASLSGTVVTVTFSGTVPAGGYGLEVFPTFG